MQSLITPSASAACGCDTACNEIETDVRPDTIRRALRLEYLTVGWDVVEGLVAVGAAIMAGSVAILGFGIDHLDKGRGTKRRTQGHPRSIHRGDGVCACAHHNHARREDRRVRQHRRPVVMSTQMSALAVSQPKGVPHDQLPEGELFCIDGGGSENPARAGASFVPSPAMATVRCWVLSSRTTACF
jgi:hypothetical protein